jgi:hypothetical protein
MQTFTNRLDKWFEKTEGITGELSYASTQLKAASEDLPTITKNLCTASEGAVEVIEAAKKSWFIRRYLPKEKKEKIKKPPKRLKKRPPKHWRR